MNENSNAKEAPLSPSGASGTAAMSSSASNQSNLDALATLAVNSGNVDLSKSTNANSNFTASNNFNAQQPPAMFQPPQPQTLSSTQLASHQVSQWQQLLNNLQQQASANSNPMMQSFAVPTNWPQQQQPFPFATNNPIHAQLQALLGLGGQQQPQLFTSAGGTTTIAEPATTTNYTTAQVAARPNAVSTTTSTAALPNDMIDSTAPSTDDEQHGHHHNNKHGKQEQKRAANRRSAQLSRKRKKQFLEELRDENDILRRKEQILRSIPDLVVVFDSSGKVHFVSESVRNFINVESVDELIGRSFWNRLCEDSTKRLKAAFMDSLEERPEHADTVTLGTTGQWDVNLIVDGTTHKPVSLNGVVHFAGDRPECVCSIRAVNNDNVTTLRTTKSYGMDVVENHNLSTKDAVRISDSGQSSTGDDSESCSGNEQIPTRTAIS